MTEPIPHVPIALQLSDQIRGDIALGVYVDKLPSNTDVATRYGVARQTARVALTILEQEGLIRMIQGIGTLIDRNSLARLEASRGFLEAAERFKFFLLDPQVDDSLKSRLVETVDVQIGLARKLRNSSD